MPRQDRTARGPVLLRGELAVAFHRGDGKPKDFRHNVARVGELFGAFRVRHEDSSPCGPDAVLLRPLPIPGETAKIRGAGEVSNILNIRTVAG